jgi:hypothetical protein
LDVPGYPEGISTIVAGTTSTTVVTSTPIYSVVFGYSTYATFTKSSSASGNFAPSPAVYITVAADTLTGLVNMIEAKLDAGGTFYNFVAGRFTAICNTLGTFLGTDTVASLLYNIKANTDTINSKVSMPDVLKFDFGGPQAAFQPDYIHITNATAYSADLGYGWASATGMSYRDRGTANYAETGLVFSNASETFRVDLPNGNYTVAVTQGDAAWAHDGMTITAGSYTATVSNVAGGYTQTVFTACVTGGNLQITLGKATGATDPNWVLNGIVIYKSWNK